jgi:hypothetical protein
MIRPLRQRHYHVFVALGFLLPIVFAFGIVARKPFPTMDTLPGRLSAPVEKFLVCKWERTDLFVKSPIQVRLLREKLAGGSLAVTFSTAKDYSIKPDLIVYWIAGQSTVNDKLPDQAKLLGGFNSGALLLPPEAAATNGVLLLYSLADNEIVDVSKPIDFRQPVR